MLMKIMGNVYYPAFNSKKPGRKLIASFASASFLFASSLNMLPGQITHFPEEAKTFKVELARDLDKNGRLEKIVVCSVPEPGLTKHAFKGMYVNTIAVYDELKEDKLIYADMEKGNKIMAVIDADVNGKKCLEIIAEYHEKYLCYRLGYGVYKLDENNKIIALR